LDEDFLGRIGPGMRRVGEPRLLDRQRLFRAECMKFRDGILSCVLDKSSTFDARILSNSGQMLRFEFQDGLIFA
jgi:hypothetical protein